MPAPVAIDTARSLERLGGDREALNGLIEIVCEDSPLLVERIESSLRDESLSEVVRAAHSLTALAMNFNCEAVAGLARQIEQFGSEADLDSIAKTIEPLKGLVQQMTDKLSEIRRTMEPG